MTQNALQVFSYKGNEVRTVDVDGETWFVAADVCGILELTNTTEALKALDEDEKNTLRITEGNRGNPTVNIVSEAGLYKLIFNSRKPEAKEFTRWVTHDVLPAIRKTGSYSMKITPADLELRHKELDAKNRELDLRGAELLQHMIDSPAYPITDESKAILAHEVSKLITGYENRAMLPAVKEAMYSATEIGARFGITKNKVGKIANAHNLKPPIGETNEYGTWIRTKSPNSRTNARSSCITTQLWTSSANTQSYTDRW